MLKTRKQQQRANSSLKGDDTVGILDLIQRKRDETKKRLNHSHLGEKDVEYMVKSIKGLIAINKEIWDRCEDCTVVRQSSADATKQVAVYRESYENVQVKNGSLVICPGIEVKTFDPPTAMPKTLTDIIAHSDTKGGIFPIMKITLSIV